MERLDKYLFKQNLTESRSKSQQLIELGQVKVNGQVVKKTSFMVKAEDDIEITHGEFKYVARSALKLLTAIKEFNLQIKGKSILDVGSSTGGFIQVLDEYEAGEIYGIDVGENQLHSSLKDNKKIKNFEKVNARYELPFKNTFDLITCDVSFISILKILPNLCHYLNPEGEILFLLKPQFESNGVNLKKGVLPLKYHQEIFNHTLEFLNQINLELIKSCPSQIQGKEGNQEYLWLVRKQKNNQLKNK